MSYQTATSLLAELRAGKRSSKDLVEAAIARIGNVDAGLNAVVVRDLDEVKRAEGMV